MDEYRFDFTLGQEIKITDPKTAEEFTAKVIGVDHYDSLISSGDPSDADFGLQNHWTSYTLEADDPAEGWGKRFWAVDSQRAREVDSVRESFLKRSFYVASQNAHVPEGFEHQAWLSGAVQLNVEGEALHAIDTDAGKIVQGVLNTYLNPETREVWAEEAFLDEDGLPQRMVFDARFDVDFTPV